MGTDVRERLLVSDIDGVICDLVSSFLFYAYRLVGGELHMPWEITAHDKILSIFDSCDADVKATLKLLLYDGRPDIVYVQAKPYFCGLRLLQSWKGVVHFVTSRQACLEDVTHRWLDIWVGQRGLGRAYELTVCNNRDAKITKMIELAKTAPAMIIDDDPTVTQAISDAETVGSCPVSVRVALILQPWNAQHLRVGASGRGVYEMLLRGDATDYSGVWR